MTYDPNNPYGAPGRSGVTPIGNRQAPWPPQQGSMPAEVPTFGDFATTGNPFQRTPLAEVWTLLPHGNNLAMMNRQRPVTWTVNANAQVSGPTTTNLRFSRPTAVFQMMGTSVPEGDQAAAIVGDPRDQFTVTMQRASASEELINAPALGSTVLGTAERPFKLAPNAWLFDRGEELIVDITPLRGNLRICINFSVAEIRGPANFTWSAVTPGP